MYKRIGVLAVVILLLFSVLSPAAAQVQTGLTVSESAAQIDFPLKLNFGAKVTSDADVTDVRLRYKTEQFSYADVTSEALIEFVPARTVDAKWSFELRKIGGLPPGTNLEYWWLAKNARGETVETRPTPLQFNDNRYRFRSLSQGKITIFWYDGNDSFSRALMDTAQNALVRLGKDTGASLERPVKIYIYSGARDLQGAMVFPQEWTGGVSYSQFSIIGIGIAPSQLAWGQGAMTHELAHIVFFQMTVNPYNEPPVWLNEGFAMYAEGALAPEYTNQLARALATNSLFSVRSLSSPFSAFTEQSLQSYAQSYSLVDFLIRQYGSAKMLELLNTFRRGSGYDEAFRKVYNLDMDGLDAQWRNFAKAQYGQIR